MPPFARQKAAYWGMGGGLWEGGRWCSARLWKVCG